jgi:hypothetical protein
MMPALPFFARGFSSPRLRAPAWDAPRVHLRIGSLDFALFIDEIADAIGIAGLRIRAGAVRHAELAISVTQELVRKIEFLGECRIRIDAVETYPQYDDALTIEIGVVVAEPATFDCSARGIGLGVEP